MKTEDVPKTPDQTGPVMTVRELSAYLQVHPSKIYRMARLGEIPGFRVGASWRFNVETINRWVSQRAVPDRKQE